MGMFSKVIYSKKTRAKKKAKKAEKKAAKAAQAREAYLADMALRGEGFFALAGPLLEGAGEMAQILHALIEGMVEVEAPADVEAAAKRQAAQEAELAAATVEAPAQ